jgi:hypothetical protein
VTTAIRMTSASLYSCQTYIPTKTIDFIDNIS